jgi:hypothetical protein
MKTETKFNIGQEVWVRTETSSVVSTIKAIKVVYDWLHGNIVGISEYLYYVDFVGWVEDDEIFPTKEELIASL